MFNKNGNLDKFDRPNRITLGDVLTMLGCAGLIFAVIGVLIFLLVIKIVGHGMYNSEENVNGLRVFYNESGDAFAGYYHWDGEHTEVTVKIPETVNGGKAKVKKLGGHYGRGATGRFQCDLTEGLRKTYPDAKVTEVRVSEYARKDNIEKVEVIIHVYIGKNIESSGMADSTARGCLVEEKDKTTLYMPKVDFTCDPDNKTFYSKDGKIYFRSDDSEAEIWKCE